jgi:hypothetical protein
MLVRSFNGNSHACTVNQYLVLFRALSPEPIGVSGNHEAFGTLLSGGCSNFMSGGGC